MKEKQDPWHVRLPDGRVIKAKTTASVRHHIEAGRIPKGSLVRRSKNGEWQTLEWTNEFADLVGGKPREQLTSDTNAEVVRFLAGKSEPEMKLESVGAHGIVEDLYAAFDNAVHKHKLVLGGLVCGISAVAGFAVHHFLPEAVKLNPKLVNILSLLISFLVAAVGVTWISRQSHLELSRMTPVPLAEARKDSLGYWLSLVIAYLIVFGIVGGAFYGLQQVPDQLGLKTGLESSLLGFGILLAALPFATLPLLALLLGPIGPVEEYHFLKSFSVWRQLVVANTGRILLFESFALVLGLIAALPTLIPLQLALNYSGGQAIAATHWAGQMGVAFLEGFAYGPALVFVTVANVILYLSLRYEFSAHR